MTGSLTDAAAVLDGAYSYFDMGSARRVYRVGDIVYKVGISTPEDNMCEWKNYLSLAYSEDMPDNVRVPDTALFMVGDEPVIAMEYIAGQPKAKCYCIPGMEKCMPDCLSPDEIELLSPFINDLEGYNVILSDGIYYIIDMDC